MKGTVPATVPQFRKWHEEDATSYSVNVDAWTDFNTWINPIVVAVGNIIMIQAAILRFECTGQGGSNNDDVRLIITDGTRTFSLCQQTNIAANGEYNPVMTVAPFMLLPGTWSLKTQGFAWNAPAPPVVIQDQVAALQVITLSRDL